MFLKARMLVYVDLGGGGNPRNTTDLPHPYIRILNRAVELTSKCFITVLFRLQSVMLHVELRVVVLLYMTQHHLMSRSDVIKISTAALDFNFVIQMIKDQLTCRQRNRGKLQEHLIILSTCMHTLV